VAEGGGAWKEYAGGYTDWVRQRPAAVTEEKASSKSSVREKSRAKLSCKETRELASLPKEIEALKAEQRSLAAKMSATEYFRQPAEELRRSEAQRRDRAAADGEAGAVGGVGGESPASASLRTLS